jgi:hypothetical protein
MVPVSRRRPFAADGQQLARNRDEADRLWRQRVAQAAGCAADDLAEKHDPHSRELYADLRALEARMTDDDQPPEANDPRGGAR